MYFPKWSAEEDEVLRKFYIKFGSRHVAELLGRPQKGVQNRAQVLGVALNKNIQKELRRKKELEAKLMDIARIYDPFGRPLAVFCIKRVTVHRLKID